MPGSPDFRARLAIPLRWGRVTPGMRRALLDALDDLERFLAAHRLLVYAETTRAAPARSFELSAVGLPSSRPVEYDGVRIDLRRDGAKAYNVGPGTGDRRRFPRVDHDAARSWACDPAERAAVRDR